MNKIILMGRLGKNPETRQISDGKSVSRFSLAVDRKFKKDGDSVTADFFNCSSFGKQAEFVEKYLKQGTKVVVTGRVQNDNYTNKDGQKVYSVQVIVEEIEFAESKSSSYTPAEKKESKNEGGFIPIPDGIDEELPFN